MIVTNPPFKYCQEFVLKALGKATKELMKIIDFNNTTVLEPACGTLAISKVIEKYTNANIINKDIVSRVS